MDADESLMQVKRLLELLPEVKVVWTRTSPTRIRLCLAIKSPHSLALLAHVARASNVGLGVEVAWHWHGDKDDPECIWYDIRIPKEVTPYDPPTLQIVGIYLARYLKKQGRLDASEADALQRTWNAEVE